NLYRLRFALRHLYPEAASGRPYLIFLPFRDGKGRKVFQKQKMFFSFFSVPSVTGAYVPEPNVPFPPSRSGAKVGTLDIYSNRSHPFLSQQIYNALEDWKIFLFSLPPWKS
ncbi:MAG TPA: hypothetical protein VKZ57_03845, partial [Sphingobacterium sp.]|nr:hypothetical protein [Sphingobacterium sp.]